jgi:hypothetical protein
MSRHIIRQAGLETWMRDIISQNMTNLGLATEEGCTWNYLKFSYAQGIRDTEVRT